MCGFCGFTGGVDAKSGFAAAAVIKNMSEKIVHRGPDGYGEYIDEAGRFNCGFRRLSIIGLIDGEQPIYNESGDVVVFLNGEIYNYKELKERLTEKGHVFKTSCDTEVLAHLYEEEGVGMTAFLRGMFAFLIFDKVTGQIFGVRDFFGIKPFYYSLSEGRLLFASEIKAFTAFPEFTPELNEEVLEHYLTFQYSPMESETFFKGVAKLPPGCSFTYNDGEFELNRWFENGFRPEDGMSEGAAVDEIERVALDSVEAHKVSDVEVGSFLSSGVDSSFIAAASKVDKTFTVGFDYDNYNEIKYAKKLSETVGIKNFEKLISTEEYWDALPKVQYHMDEPLADPAAVALYFVSSLAAEHVKVALSGEGADEFFGGYNIYREPAALRPLTRLPRWVRKAVGAAAKILPNVKGKNFLIRGSLDVEERFIGNAKLFSVKERRRLLKRNGACPACPACPAVDFQNLTKPFYDRAKGLDDVTKMQYIDVNMWLVGDILLKADKMSMANSLEVRVPFLDKEVFETARKIPTELRVNKSATKYAFRKAAARHIPRDSAEKKKLGFPVPVRVWLREEKYYNVVNDAFGSEAAKKYFDERELKKLLERHKKGKADESRKIWAVYMFLVWYGEFFGKAGKEAV